MTEHDRVLVIAEAGVNHDGDLGKAMALVDAAADVGADIVKFQTFRANALATTAAPKAAYQKRLSGEAETQHAMLSRLELSEADHVALVEHARARGLEFLSTPFDEVSLALLERLGVARLKIGSGDLTNAPLLLAVARTGRPLILSTGMADLSDVEEALGVLAFGYAASTVEPRARSFRAAWHAQGARAVLRDRVVLLHCTTDYPCAPSDVNLRAMDTMATAFGLPVGYSDHTDGEAVSVAAVARGARVIEKHVTLDRSAPGPDHAASLEPEAFASLVRAIRSVEAALGDGIKRPSPVEIPNIRVARKSVVARRPIRAGQRIEADDLACKRPGDGLRPISLYDLVGSIATRDVAIDEPL